MPSLDQLNPAEPVNTLPASASSALAILIQQNLGSVFPALALTVVHRGDVLLNGGWGWIDPQTHQVPVTSATRFDLASVTKIFTTTAFLQIISELNISLDAPLISVIPEFGASGPRPINGGQDPHSKAMLPTPPEDEGKTVDPATITFRHLLTHTSGLAPWRDVYNAAGEPPSPPNQIDLAPRSIRWENALKAICEYPFVGVPGDKVRYSDLGLMLLGEATSRLSGQSGALEHVIANRVTKPLGLDTVTFNPVRNGVDPLHIAPTEADPTWRKRRPWGEVHDENACGVGGVAGHAGLFATARDVAALGEAWRTHDPRLNIQPALMDEAVREHAETDGMRRGLGWVLKTHEAAWMGDLFSPNSYGHTGFTGTSLAIEPERELVVVALTNSVYPGRLLPGTYEFRRALHDLIATTIDEL